MTFIRCFLLMFQMKRACRTSFRIQRTLDEILERRRSTEVNSQVEVALKQSSRIIPTLLFLELCLKAPNCFGCCIKTQILLMCIVMTLYKVIYLNKRYFAKFSHKIYKASLDTLLNFWPSVKLFTPGGESGNKTGCEQTKTNRKI